jgi:hypothetical protein
MILRFFEHDVSNLRIDVFRMEIFSGRDVQTLLQNIYKIRRRPGNRFQEKRKVIRTANNPRAVRPYRY